LDQKVINFFLCVFAKKYMEIVWDIQRVVHTPEVTTRDEESVRDTGTNRESDLTLGSKSPVRSPYVW
jgi:hypothetical protein